jgi:MoaA/NifB/PqqE/SkfB family radical SAM enzyme
MIGSDGQLSFGEDLLAHAYQAMTQAASADPYRALALVRVVGGTLERMSRRKKVRAELGIPVPEVIFLSVTGDCNLHCPHCYAGGYAKEHMPIDLAERIISEACELGVAMFVITGGEPLLYPEFFAMARETPHVPFLTFTNGTLMPDFLADGGAGANMLWAVSVDGPKRWNDARRGEGTFDLACEAMEALSAQRLPFGFSATLSRDNLIAATSHSFIASMALRGCRMGFLLQEMPGTTCDSVVEGLEERAESCREHSPIPLASFPGDEARYGGCLGAGRAFLHIAPDGSVEPCPIVHVPVASLKEMSLEAALSSPPLRGFRAGGRLARAQSQAAESLVAASDLLRTA